MAKRLDKLHKMEKHARANKRKLDRAIEKERSNRDNGQWDRADEYHIKTNTCKLKKTRYKKAIRYYSKETI
jgi:hypothetical protein